MIRTLRTLLLAAPLALAACGSSHVFTDADIAGITKFDDIMWSQAQAADPAFKRMGKATLTEEDFVIAEKAGNRLKLTSVRLLEKNFSKGPDFDAFAGALAGHADELAKAAAAKDSDKTKLALKDTKDTCRACHKKFK